MSKSIAMSFIVTLLISPCTVAKDIVPTTTSTDEKKLAPAPATVRDNKKAAPSTTTSTTNIDVNALADAIQKQYNLTKTATFRFDQNYVHPFLSGADSTNNSKGDVAYDKTSGSMMWNYLEPQNRQKKFYINGNKFTFYSLSDKIAYTHDCYDKDTLSASVAFLLGTGNLKDSFTIAPVDTAVSNKALSWLSLIPKEANAPVKKITLGATKDGKVVESIVEDPSGGRNHFKFIDFKVNPKIAPSIFVFNAPPGVRVQPMPNIECVPKKGVDVKPDTKKSTTTTTKTDNAQPTTKTKAPVKKPQTDVKTEEKKPISDVKPATEEKPATKVIEQPTKK